jgi:hypothetical protein
VANNVNVTNRGFEYIASMLAGSISTFPIPSNIGWGTANGSNATSVVLPGAAPTGFPLPGPSTAGTGQWFDVGPYSESTEARVAAGTPVIVSNNSSGSSYATTTFVATITAAQAESIGESFLVPSTTKPASSSLTSHAATNANGSLTVVSSAGYPAAPFYAQADNEVVLVGTAAANVLTVTRAQNGSTAGPINIGDAITVGNIPGAGASNPNHGDMFAHAGFVALSLNSGDSIQFTWQVNVTS